MDRTSLDAYLARLKRLRSDASASRWTETTRHRAPHKPLLLLAVARLIGAGYITRNQVVLDEALHECFVELWRAVMEGDERRASPAMPFWHLQSDKFWHLLPREDIEQVLQTLMTHRATSASMLERVTTGARLDEDLFALLGDPAARAAVEQTLIEHYFDTGAQERLKAALAPQE